MTHAELESFGGCIFLSNASSLAIVFRGPMGREILRPARATNSPAPMINPKANAPRISIHIPASERGLTRATKETFILLRAGSRELRNIHIDCCAIAAERSNGREAGLRLNRPRRRHQSSIARVSALPRRPATVLARTAHCGPESIDAGPAPQPDASASQPEERMPSLDRLERKLVSGFLRR